MTDEAIAAKELVQKLKEFGIRTNPTSARAYIQDAARTHPDWVVTSPRAGQTEIKLKNGHLLDFALRYRFMGLAPPAYRTITSFLADAKERGLSASKPGVKYRLRQWLAKPDAHMEKLVGIATDRYDARHRVLLSPTNQDALLSWARMRKNAPQMVRVGMLVPVKTLCDELSLEPSWIHHIPLFKKQMIKIGRIAYVNATMADRIRRYIREGDHRRRKPMLLRKKPHRPMP
ncbi:MAG: hypothetical protein Q7R47_05305 [Candidatus Diapherotrites archaeon]|nr:hypothetical protein [Candidatus Diapherotrites archaeon]